MPHLNLPVLDLSLLDRGHEAAARFRDLLRAASHDVGFFYLTGTGVSPDLERRLHRAARDFFALPEADKLAIENVNSPHFRGYTRIGGERTQGRTDWREQIDIGPEQAPLTGGPDFNRLVGPNLWPAELPELPDFLTGHIDPLTGFEDSADGDGSAARAALFGSLAPSPEAAASPGGSGENPYADLQISRNAPCPCGSGNKYKHCHGALN